MKRFFLILFVLIAATAFSQIRSVNGTAFLGDTVTASGRWQSGVPAIDNDLLAVSSRIECYREMKQCVEATAQRDKTTGRIWSDLVWYQIISWNSSAVIATAKAGICVNSTLRIEQKTGVVTVSDSPTGEAGFQNACKSPAMHYVTYRLEP